MSVTHVTDAEFEEKVLGAEGPVLVDFWAEWCGPCKAIAPALEEIAGEMSGTLSVAKLDVDSNPSTPAKYGIRGIPTLILFKDGEVADTKVARCPRPSSRRGCARRSEPKTGNYKTNPISRNLLFLNTNTSIVQAMTALSKPL